ncbi:hypothetical protein Q8A73_004054 [Channa argus]|nr:hypothetical protein Q8A73_004054 [Channa argus]
MSFPVAEGLIGQCEDQRGSNGEEEEKEEEDEEDKDDDDEAEEEDEEENDTSSGTEAPDDLTEKPTDASPSPKPEELSEEHEPDGEQKAAVISNEPITAAKERTDVGVKPANGTAHSSANQSGPSKKLSLFRRLSSTKSKQTSGRDQTPAEGTDSGNAAAQGRPSSSAPSGNNHPETNRGRASQRSRSGACTLL